MDIAIFGASGRTGLPLLEQALAAGHHVTALVRTPAKIPFAHPQLTIIQGDVGDRSAVEQTITPTTQVVVVLLAPSKSSPVDLLPRAAEHILTTMQQRHISRLIWMTGAGVPAPEDRPQLPDRLIKFALKTLSGSILEQSEAAVDKVRSSDREWVVVRAPMLIDGPRKHTLRAGWVGVGTGIQLVRADGAAFILDQLSDATYVGKAPMISN